MKYAQFQSSFRLIIVDAKSFLVIDRSRAVTVLDIPLLLMHSIVMCPSDTKSTNYFALLRSPSTRNQTDPNQGIPQTPKIPKESIFPSNYKPGNKWARHYQNRNRNRKE
jgi:hypothetical protein